MFERFTDRARTIMRLANQEALRFNHEYLGTEHILLGLVKEGSGIGSCVLRHLGIDLPKIRLEVDKRLTSGPDTVTMGKLPQTPRAKKVVEYAIEEARKLDHNYVGTEHLLLGICRETEGLAAEVLKSLGATLEVVRKNVTNLLGEEIIPIDLTKIDVSGDEVVAPFSFRFKDHKSQFELLDADGTVVDSHGFTGLIGAYLFNAMKKHEKSQKLLREIGIFLGKIESCPENDLPRLDDFARRIQMILDSD